jgi:putative DNA primase/helicase
MNGPAVTSAPAPAQNGEAVRHISELRAGLPDELLTPLWCKREKRSQSRYFANPVAAAGHAVHESGDADVYVGFGFVTRDAIQSIGKYRRPSANDVAGLPGLWLDLDVEGTPAGRGGVKNTGAPSLEAAIEAAHMIVEPTLLILSGGGVHAWWLFDEPLIFASKGEREHAQLVPARWQEKHCQQADFPIDAAHDLARVMRVAGTRNHKGGEKGEPVCFEPGHDGPRHD